MRVFVEQLMNLDVNSAIFLGLDIQKGWLLVDNDSFGRIYVEGLDASDPRSAIYADANDIVLEEEDIKEIKYFFENMNDINEFVEYIKRIMESVHDNNYRRE